MVEYLMSLDSLYEVSLANLGPMDAKTYIEFEAEMYLVAATKGLRNPKMAIDVKLKEPSEFGILEQPYQPTKEEWQIILKDTKTKTVSMPNVHVVDGDKFAIPI